MRRFLFGSRLRTMTTAVVAVAITTAGVALAVWVIASGSGDARGVVGTPTSVTLTVTPITSAQTIVPGQTNALGVRIHNPYSQPLTITAATVDGPATISAGGTCANSAQDLNTHATFDASPLVGLPLPATSDTDFLGPGPTATADAGLPACLAGAVFAVPITVTAAP